LTAAAAIVVVSLLGSLVSAWSAGNTGLSALLAPLLLSVVWAVVLPIASKLWVKLRFMRDLTPRTPPQAAIDASGQQLKEDGQDSLGSDGQVELPAVPSIIPDYDRTTMHGSVAPPVEPFAAGLAGMLPPPEARVSVSEPPPSNRGPMVIRVDVPSLSPAAVSMSPRAESLAPSQDAQFSALARRALSGDDEPDSLRDHASSVMPTAAAQRSGAPAPVASVPSVIPVQSGLAAHTPTPVSMVPSSEAPEISVGVLAMPHLRVEQPAGAGLPTPAPILIPMGPPTPVAAAPLTAPAAPPSDVAHPDQGSGVRHVLLRNEPGVLREVCSPVVLNRCS
jgi:hypothetical protein